MHDEIERELENFTYRLSLNEQGNILWNYDYPGARSVTDKEPGMSFFKRFVIGATGLLGIELQL